MSNGQTEVTLGLDNNLNWGIKGFVFFSGKNFEDIMKPDFVYKPLDNDSVVILNPFTKGKYIFFPIWSYDFKRNSLNCDPAHCERDGKPITVKIENNKFVECKEGN